MSSDVRQIKEVKRLDILSKPGSGATITLFDDKTLSQAYKWMFLAIDASHDSAANGVEFSVALDGVTYETIATYTYSAADNLKRFPCPIMPGKMRCRYTNSANVLTDFDATLYLSNDTSGDVDIGNVDVTSVTPGTSATSLGKAEDAAHTSGDTGVAILGVRRDAPASGASADGDYATINVDSLGRTRVQTGGAATYCSTTEGTVTSGTTGATTVRLAHLWHPSAETLAYRIQSITATWAGGAGGDPVQFRLYKTTALGTPGATTKTITQTGGTTQALNASTNFYGGHTGDPTRDGIVAIAAAMLSSPGSIEFSAKHFVDGEPLTLAASADGGYELVVVTGTAGPATAAGIAVDVAFSAR